MDLRPVLAWNADQFADDLRGHERAHVVHEVDLAAIAHAVKDRAANRADARFELTDHARLEVRHEVVAELDVAGRVHREDHVAHHRELLGREVLEHHAALRGREQHRVFGDVDDVGVLEDRPVAGFARHVLEVDRLLTPQALEHGVGRPVDVAVGRIDVDLVGHRAPAVVVPLLDGSALSPHGASQLRVLPGHPARCQHAAMTERVHLTIDGAIATITNDNPDKHNAFDDEMDAELFAILDDLARRTDIRAVIWRGEGKSFSSGRDVGSIGTMQVELSHHELMRRGHRGIQRLWDIDAPVIVACKGWVMGGSFQRALLCDIRIAAPETRFRLPEVTYGVIPDTGGVAVLYEMCGPGLVTDMVLTGRILSAEEALDHGIVSRIVPAEALDATAREMAEEIAAAPAVTVKMAREVIKHLSLPPIRSAMTDEMIYQTFINRSDDFAELRAARAEDRSPRYTGS